MRFAVICLPDFRLQALLRPHPELATRPVALVDPSESAPVVLEFTAAAREAGVAAGMTPAQALARSSQLLIKSRSPAQERAATEALLDCARAFSPYVELTSHSAVTLNLNGLRIESGTAWAAKILATLLRLNLAAQVGIGPTPNLAWHAARAARPILVLDNSAEFLASLPVSTLDPTPETLALLTKWGVHTTGQFLALGKEAIGERLGTEGLELLDRASPTLSRPLQLVDPPVSFEEAIEFEHEIETTEALLFILRRFVEQLSLRLELVYLVAEQLALRLTLADGSHYACVLKIPAPTRKIDTLFRMLQTHLESLRTDHPIVALSLAARPCRPASEQLELFEPGLRDPNRFFETLARLSALVGHDRVGVPVMESTHRPDAFRLNLVSLNPDQPRKTAGKPIVLNVRGLCLRRFRPPLPAKVERRDGKPVRLASRQLTGRIFKTSGPWHTSGDWWDTQPWARLEWDIQTSSGALCRLVQERSGKWFLEGIYD